MPECADSHGGKPPRSLLRPLGVFLSGGGALGAWQAGALEALIEFGVVFDEIMGFSIGAVNGAALAFGRMDEALRRWRTLDGAILRPRPRLSPPSLCSDEPLRGLFAESRDEATAKAALKIPLTVISACAALGEAVYARFTPGGPAPGSGGPVPGPGGRDGWDGWDGWDAPLADHVAASCAVPLIFPSVDLDFRGRRLRLIDGGVPQPTPMRFEALAHCASVLVLEVTGAADMGWRPSSWSRSFWDPWRGLDQQGRQSSRTLISEGVGFLLRGRRPPRVYRLPPSRRLDSVMLDFSAGSIRPRLSLGACDARAFLADVPAYEVLAPTIENPFSKA